MTFHNRSNCIFLFKSPILGPLSYTSSRIFWLSRLQPMVLGIEEEALHVSAASVNLITVAVCASEDRN